MEEREEERVCVADILWDVHVMVVKMNEISVIIHVYICGCLDTCMHTHVVFYLTGAHAERKRVRILQSMGETRRQCKILAHECSSINITSAVVLSV